MGSRRLQARLVLRVARCLMSLSSFLQSPPHLLLLSSSFTVACVDAPAPRLPAVVWLFGAQADLVAAVDDDLWATVRLGTR